MGSVGRKAVQALLQGSLLCCPTIGGHHFSLACFQGIHPTRVGGQITSGIEQIINTELGRDGGQIQPIQGVTFVDIADNIVARSSAEVVLVIQMNADHIPSVLLLPVPNAAAGIPVVVIKTANREAIGVVLEVPPPTTTAVKLTSARLTSCTSDDLPVAFGVIPGSRPKKAASAENGRCRWATNRLELLGILAQSGARHENIGMPESQAVYPSKHELEGEMGP